MLFLVSWASSKQCLWRICLISQSHSGMMTWIKATSVKVWILASHQQVNNKWIKWEKCLSEVHTSQSEEPALNLQSQQPQHGQSSIRDLSSSLTSCNCRKHFQRRITWEEQPSVRTYIRFIPHLQHWSHIQPMMCLHTTNATVLGTGTRLNLGFNCPSQCNNATIHLGGILK